ncbi:MAG: hypothetical protein A2V90_07395 [Gammaproteobacteria bacterium RBG_16_57_12]|nr:MAG: hypothetical protein A2V90_07395 [Gammaproteobacteria bacterium RBG_16_57_12]
MEAVMKSRNILFICCLLVSGLVSCHGGAKSGAQGDKPDWVDGNSRRYPVDMYLTGVGVAPDPALARDRARVELAKIFQVAVTEQGQDTQRFERTVSEGETKESNLQQVSRQSSLYTDQIIQGIEVSEIWEDGAGQYHALAVLSRQQAGMRLRQEIKRLDEATGQYVRSARGYPDSMAKIAAAQKAIQQQQERQSYQRSLQIVDITGQGLPSPWNIAELQADLNDVLSRIYFKPQVVNSQDQPLLEMLAASLAEAGFRVVRDAPANYTLQGRLALDDETVQGGWHWRRGNLELILLDSDDTPVGTRTLPIKASAAQSGLLQQRLMIEIETVLKSRLRDTLLEFFQ